MGKCMVMVFIGFGIRRKIDTPKCMKELSLTGKGMEMER